MKNAKITNVKLVVRNLVQHIHWSSIIMRNIMKESKKDIHVPLVIRLLQVKIKLQDM